MSVRVISRVWDASAAEPTARFVLVAIADCANDEGHAFPGVANLAKKTGLDRTAVMRAVRALEALGELRVQRTFGRGNRYDVLLGTSRAERPVAHSDPSRTATDQSLRATTTSRSQRRDQSLTATLTVKEPGSLSVNEPSDPFARPSPARRELLTIEQREERKRALREQARRLGVS